MAEIAPFRGLRYNPERIPELDRVVIPPYDVISKAEQSLFDELSPFNMVHLELGPERDGDSAVDNPHTRAAAYFQDWQARGVLVRDPEPALYYYELDYSLCGEAKTRTGFIGLLKLEDFAGGCVRPHEKTFASVKDERLALMNAVHANLSPIYALYSDPEARVDAALQSACGGPPPVAFTDRYRLVHRLWPVVVPEVIGRVRELLHDQTIFIADGHHRYETALNYRNLMRRCYPQAGARASFEYVMMYLSNLHDDGASILPTHRLLKARPDWNDGRLLETAATWFEIRWFAGARDGLGAWAAALRAELDRKRTAIGFYHQGVDGYYLLQADYDAIDPILAADGVPEVLRHLDVVILDRIVLRRLLGFSDQDLGNPRNIRFHHSLPEAVKEIRDGSGEWGFFVNPTRIDQVRDVAGNGFTMPHKATYFYPKVGSGLVVNPLIADEQITV